MGTLREKLIGTKLKMKLVSGARYVGGRWGIVHHICCNEAMINDRKAYFKGVDFTIIRVVDVVVDVVEVQAYVAYDGGVSLVVSCMHKSKLIEMSVPCEEAIDCEVV